MACFWVSLVVCQKMCVYEWLGHFSVQQILKHCKTTIIKIILKTGFTHTQTCTLKLSWLISNLHGGIPLSLRGSRWWCHCSVLGPCFSACLSPHLGTSTCHGYNRFKKKKKLAKTQISMGSSLNVEESGGVQYHTVLQQFHHTNLNNLKRIEKSKISRMLQILNIIFDFYCYSVIDV